MIFEYRFEISRSDITYQDNIRGNLKRKKGKKSSGSSGIFGASSSGATLNYAHIQPGQTVFEVLKTYAS